METAEGNLSATAVGQRRGESPLDAVVDMRIGTQMLLREASMQRLLRVFLVTLCLSAGSAFATPTWTVNSLNTIGCAAGATGFTTTVAGYTGGPERYRTQAGSGGLRYMGEEA